MQYQPLVATLPTLGTHATNVWYAQYQYLVLYPFVFIVRIIAQQRYKKRDDIFLFSAKYPYIRDKDMVNQPTVKRLI